MNAGEVDVDDLDLGILAVPGDVADGLRPALLAAGVLVVDLSPTASTTGGLPSIWPGLNPKSLESHPGGFGVPCATASTVAPLLAALAGHGAVSALDLTVLLGAASSGRAGEEALSRQTIALLNHRVPEPEPFGAVLAFNALAGSARARDGADPFEEETAGELRAIWPALEDATLRITAVQVPIFAGTGIAVTVRFMDGGAPTAEEAIRLVDARPDLVRVPGTLALRDAMELDSVLVSTPVVDAGGALRTFLAADGLHRTAAAVGSLVDRVIAEDLW